MAISASQVKELRDRTDAPMMECKAALEACGGDMEKAIEHLRKKGAAKAQAKAARQAKEGAVETYIHSNRKVGVLVEMTCETDFVARNDLFRQVHRDICMHVAAADPVPLAVTRDQIPADVVAKEREIYAAQAASSGKPPEIAKRMAESKLETFVKERTLLEQAFVRDDTKSVGDLITELVAKLGENVGVRRFVRFRVGE